MSFDKSAGFAAVFQTAVRHHLEGRFPDALAHYDRAIALNPAVAATHCNRGLALQSLGQASAALDAFDTAIRLEPSYADAHYNRGIVLRQLKRPQDALQSYDRALRLAPDSAETHANRGNVLRDLGRSEEAVASFDRAIALKPDMPEAYYNCGNALMDLQRHEHARESYGLAIRLRPDFAEAYYNRANVLQALGRRDDAVADYDQALQLGFDLADLHFNKANVLQDLKRYEDAVLSYDRALARNSDYAEAYSNRGNALRILGRPQEAVQSCERAIALNPALAEAHNNKGFALLQLNELDAAVRSYDEAVRLRPNFADALWNKSICLLLQAQFAEGWPLYEWRKKTSEPLGVRRFPKPEWLGRKPLDGATLLIHAEQGLGDTIQFCRYVKLARARATKVIFAVQPALVRLLSNFAPGVEVVSLDLDIPQFDYHTPLLSLPLAFGTDETNIPDFVPYLRAEPDRVRNWRERLGDSGFKIGICWQGNRSGEVDIGRSFPVRWFERLSQIPGVRLISLQKYDGAEQLAVLPAEMRVEIPGDDFDIGPDAFVDTAAMMTNLDLVITSDTATAHLAGALGRPVWVALQHVPDWRWLLDRTDSPWYPTMRLFRQRKRGDWAGVFAEIEQALRCELPPSPQGEGGS
jgi:tetratricopeptide (TPR) repeat protein